MLADREGTFEFFGGPLDGLQVQRPVRLHPRLAFFTETRQAPPAWIMRLVGKILFPLRSRPPQNLMAIYLLVQSPRGPVYIYSKSEITTVGDRSQELEAVTAVQQLG
jgi:hypothetical protein